MVQNTKINLENQLVIPWAKCSKFWIVWHDLLSDVTGPYFVKMLLVKLIADHFFRLNNTLEVSTERRCIWFCKQKNAMGNLIYINIMWFHIEFFLQLREKWHDNSKSVPELEDKVIFLKLLNSKNHIIVSLMAPMYLSTNFSVV